MDKNKEIEMFSIKQKDLIILNIVEAANRGMSRSSRSYVDRKINMDLIEKWENHKNA